MTLKEVKDHIKKIIFRLQAVSIDQLSALPVRVSFHNRISKAHHLLPKENKELTKSYKRKKLNNKFNWNRLKDNRTS